MIETIDNLTTKELDTQRNDGFDSVGASRRHTHNNAASLGLKDVLPVTLQIPLNVKHITHLVFPGHVHLLDFFDLHFSPES